MKNFYKYPGKAEAQVNVDEMRNIHQWGRKRTVNEALESQQGYQSFVIGWVKSLAIERMYDRLEVVGSDDWQAEAIKIYAEMGIEAEVKWNEVYPK